MIRALPLVLALAACAAPPDVPAGARVGEPIQPRTQYRLADVQAEPAKYLNQTLLVEANIKAVCQSMGCWMQVEDGGETGMVRWEAGCGGEYTFPKDAAGGRVLIQGSFYPKQISREDAEHLEGESDRAIKIPEQTYEMNASAIVMLERQ